MKQLAGSLFRDERARHALRFTCEDCTHFASERGACTHGYPNEQHRAARYQGEFEELWFCKDFDLR